MSREAMLYEQLEGNQVRCNLCAHRCVIADGRTGVCKVRENRGGELVTLVYGRTISQNIDPIEKKPLYHFLPGTRSFSIATPGCNFHCRWCQNWDIVEYSVTNHRDYGKQASPDELVASAKREGSESIAYTYTEPTIFFEYAFETAKLAHQAGLANVFVTNGYMTPEMLEAMDPYLDAANVDLKAFREKTYQRYVGAALEPVLDNLIKMKEMGIWVEVTTLVIPKLNDDPEELREAASFIARELGPETPWHLSRFYPHREMKDHPQTPIWTLREAQEIGHEEGLHHIYLGNTGDESNTFCHQCGQLLIKRRGFWVLERKLRRGKCPECGTAAAGVWTL